MYRRRLEAPTLTASLPAEMVKTLRQLLLNGSTCQAAARLTSLSVYVVAKFKRELKDVPELCGCGERWDHDCQCWWRVSVISPDPSVIEAARQLQRARWLLRSVQQALVSHGPRRPKTIKVISRG